MEFVGTYEKEGWTLAGTLVPLAYIGWSLWLLALGIALLVVPPSGFDGVLDLGQH